MSPHDIVVTIDRDGNITQHEVAQVFTYLGLSRLETEEAQAGDIVAITGLKKVSIG